MKNILLLILLIIIGIPITAQTVNFTYDNSGNRILRKTIVTLKSTETVDDSLSKEEFRDDLEDKSISVFPNPVKSQLNVYISGLKDNSKVSIYTFDQSGKLLKTIKPATSNNVIEFSDLAPGAYFINILIDDKVSKWTIIKE
ncbi:MAG TPA: T9SS type A sorting domain-containing protein [Bacteroidales bacterium]|nr:T9SS type A sorting domain-containing protein [Bacteroidales bacterium]